MFNLSFSDHVKRIVSDRGPRMIPHPWFSA